MNGPLYGLSLIPDGEGGFVGQKAVPSSGYGAYSLPLGNGYVDTFKRDRVPTPIQLCRELVGIAWACISLNANLIAGLNLRLYIKTRKGQRKHRYVEAYERQKGYGPTIPVSQKRLNYLNAHMRGQFSGHHKMDPGYSLASDTMVEEVAEHPLLDLLAKPETIDDDLGMSGFDHRWATQVFMEAVGRAYWLVEMDKALGVPKHLWLLHAQYMKEVPDTDGLAFLAMYEYGVGSNKYQFTPQDIFKFHIPDIGHLRLGGFSPLMAAFEKIGLVRKGDAQISALLQNMGFPGLIATAKQSDVGTYFGAAEARRMQSALAANLRMGGAGGVVVLPEPLDLIFPHWKPNETLSLERYQQYKVDVCNAFDTPSTILERNDSNLASAKTGDYAHAKYAGVPRATRYENVINNRLVPLYDKEKRLFVAFDNVIPDDELFELERLKAGGNLGAFTVNEFRNAAGRHDLDGPLGEARYINGNLIGEDGVPIMAVQQGPQPGAQPNPQPEPKPEKPKKPNKDRKDFVFLSTALADLTREVRDLKEAKPAPSPDAATPLLAEMMKQNRELIRALQKAGKRANQPAPVAPVSTPVEPALVVEKKPDRRDAVKAALIANGYSEEEVQAKLNAKIAATEAGTL